MHQMTDAKSKRYSTTKQVQERYGGVSHSWIWRRRRTDPRFPKPFFAGGVMLYDDEELDVYDQQLKQEAHDVEPGEAA
jgi:predicted DNA-binding transcriptional regulator AlpA